MSDSHSKEAPWQSISRRKLAAQKTALHTPSSISITVPSNLLPRDPPSPKDGPQPVYQIPAKLLNKEDNTITSLQVLELLSKLHDGSLTSTAVTKAYIRRASIAHQLTNCLTEPLFTRALEQAARLDTHFDQGSSSSSTFNRNKLIGPLHGLPVSVKDTFNVTGIDSTMGLATHCFKPVDSTAPLVTLLESLGCIIIAKTNVPQTLASLDSVNNVFGRTYNPFNRLLTAGGSSGGEGVLVAMRGSAVGFGTDIGGSIRIPAMCNGVYGFKPSMGRLPYGGQRGTGPEGVGRASVQAVAGPIGRGVEELRVVMREVGRVAWMFGEDCFVSGAATVGQLQQQQEEIPRGLSTSASGALDLQNGKGSGPNGEFVVGILRSDGNCQLLPPIRNIIDEVAKSLQQHNSQQSGNGIKIKVIDLPTPKAWTSSQSLMSKLMSVDGGSTMSQWLLETNEPLVPWMSTRFKHGGKPAPFTKVAELQAQRAKLEMEMIREVWMYGGGEEVVDCWGRRKGRTVDALVCPLASHPVPEIERWNAVGYTSSWVLFDYPAGCVPVREVREGDLELGRRLGGGGGRDETLKVLGSWDVKSRELWDEKLTDRRVYLGSMLSVQCVTGRGEDEKLGFVMGLVDEAVSGLRGKGGEDAVVSRESKL